MVRPLVLAGALGFGAAVGLIGNAVSAWALRRAGSRKETAAGTGEWVPLLAVQYVVRLGLGLISLYAAYRLSSGDASVVVMVLVGLVAARYLLLWRLARGDLGRDK